MGVVIAVDRSAGFGVEFLGSPFKTPLALPPLTAVAAVQSREEFTFITATGPAGKALSFVAAPSGYLWQGPPGATHVLEIYATGREGILLGRFRVPCERGNYTEQLFILSPTGPTELGPVPRGVSKWGCLFKLGNGNFLTRYETSAESSSAGTNYILRPPTYKVPVMAPFDGHLSPCMNSSIGGEEMFRNRLGHRILKVTSAAGGRAQFTYLNDRGDVRSFSGANDLVVEDVMIRSDGSAIVVADGSLSYLSRSGADLRLLGPDLPRPTGGYFGLPDGQLIAGYRSGSRRIRLFVVQPKDNGFCEIPLPDWVTLRMPNKQEVDCDCSHLTPDGSVIVRFSGVHSGIVHGRLNMSTLNVTPYGPWGTIFFRSKVVLSNGSHICETASGVLNLVDSSGDYIKLNVKRNAIPDARSFGLGSNQILTNELFVSGAEDRIRRGARWSILEIGPDGDVRDHTKIPISEAHELTGGKFLVRLTSAPYLATRLGIIEPSGKWRELKHANRNPTFVQANPNWEHVYWLRGGSGDGSETVHRLTVATGKVEVLPLPENLSIQSFTVAPDEKHLCYVAAGMDPGDSAAAAVRLAE